MLLSNPFEPDPRVYKEAKSLAKVGYHVRILAWDREGRFPAVEKCPEFTVERIQNKSGYGKKLLAAGTFLIFYWSLLQRIRSLPNVAVLHCHDLDTMPVGFIAAKLVRAKLIFDAHEPIYYGYFPRILRPLIDGLERGFARLADVNIVTNRFQINKFYNFHANRITEIRNCPAQDLVDSSQQQQHSSKNGELTIGRVGYIKEGTGVEIALRVYRRLLAKYPKLRLLLVGKVHPLFEQKFTDLVKEIDGNIEITGMIPYDKVGEYYRELDISLILYDDLQTHGQITPTKLLESLAFGVPVVANHVGDTRTILRTHNCGFLVNIQNENDVYEKVQLLIDNSSLRRKMGRAGIKAFTSSLNWEVMENRLFKVYNTLTLR